MSLVHGFKIVAALSVGLSCSAAWSQVDPAKVKLEEAKAAELKEEAAGADNAKLIKTGSGVLTLVGPGVFSGGPATIVTGQATAVATPAGGNQTITITNPGGTQMQAEEYGKKVTITDDPKTGIKIERTTKKGGTDVTEKYEAKNVKELEKKFPEGFKLYNQYLGQGSQGPVAGTATVFQNGVIQGAGVLQLVPAQGAIPIPGGGAVPPGGFVPLPPVGGPQFAPGQGQLVVTATAVMAPGQLEDVNAQMQGLSEGLKSFSKADKLKDAAQPVKDAAKKQIGDLKKQLADLEKQLEAK